MATNLRATTYYDDFQNIVISIGQMMFSQPVPRKFSERDANTAVYNTHWMNKGNYIVWSIHSNVKKIADIEHKIRFLFLCQTIKFKYSRVSKR